MPITERTLRKWRGEALKLHQEVSPDMYIDSSTNLIEASVTFGLTERILRLTQELLDQHLLRKEMK